MKLDLVDGGDDLGFLEETLEELDREIGDTWSLSASRSVLLKTFHTNRLP